MYRLDLIKQKRNSIGLTQKEVAEIIGMKEQSYRTFENGLKGISIECFARLIVVLELQKAELSEIIDLSKL